MRRIFAAALVLLLMLATVFVSCPVSAATTEGDTASRLINVVYDDSNSMIMNGSTAWSEAKYSMEILSAMMQEKDTMNIYFMAEFSDSYQSNEALIKNISGASSQKQANIEKIHNTVSDTGGTYFASIEKAYNDLEDASGYDEKHLVVITDGNAFNDAGGVKELDKLLKNAKKDGIKVIYLAIGGDQTIRPTLDESDGVYVYRATPNTANYEESILNKATQMCERIFQRPAHGVSGNTLELKIPVSEIVVFAQGLNVNIGDIQGASKSISTAGVTAADVDKASLNPGNRQIGGIENIRVADGLTGAVATFTPASGEYIAEGTYTLDITATSYTVYYKPCLDVHLKVTDSEGTTVKTGDEVSIGQYTAEYYLTYPKSHPKYGEQVALSGLGIDPEYTLTVTADGKSKDYVGDSPKTVELGVGSTEIKVTARYLTYISTDVSVNIAVEDMQVYELLVELVPDRKEYVASELEDDKEGFTVKVSLPDGTRLDPSLWEKSRLTMESEGIDFYEPVRNSDQTFTVRAKLKNGKYEDTKSGEIPFKATVNIKDENSKASYKGSDDGIVEMYNDVVPEKNGFKVTVTEIIPDKIESTDFNKVSPAAKVEITWNGNPLTKAQYDALELTASMKKDYKCTDENGNEVSLLTITGVELDPYEEGKATTATIRFKASGDAETQRKKLHKYDDFEVTAVIDREGVKNEAKAKDDLGVKKVWSLWEILRLIAIILLIISYLPPVKRYLPWKITYRSREYGNKMNPDHHYTYLSLKGILSLIVPGVCIRTDVDIECYKGKTPVPIGLELVALRKQNSLFPMIGGNVRARVLNKDEIVACNQAIDATKPKFSEDTVSLRSSRINDGGRVMVEFTPTE